MLRNSIQERMVVYAEEEKNGWQKVKTVYDWEQFRDKRLAALLNSLGPLPERTPLNPAVTRRIDYGEGLVIDNIVYESRPGLIVAANLYLPDKHSGQIPAIVVVHSHHAPKTQSELQNMGMTWAQVRDRGTYYGSALRRRAVSVPAMVPRGILWKVCIGQLTLPGWTGNRA